MSSRKTLVASSLRCLRQSQATAPSAAILKRSFANLANFKIPPVENEPNKSYGKGSADRKGLQAAVESMKASSPFNVPLVVAGEAKTASNSIETQANPSSHSTPLANWTPATEADVHKAVDAALAAKPAWESMPFSDRAAIFLKAADLISGKYRYQIMAATMLGQGKNAWQAEIDSAAETCDFLRFNVKFAEELYAQQPAKNSPGVWNRTEYRALEGFVYAVSPFNFTAIGANLVVAPALMGNVVVWKPSPSAVYSNYLIYKILLEAGLPPNVIQFIPGDAPKITEILLNHREFAALHYTGSTQVFRALYKKVGDGIGAGIYKGYPRVVGETGGKNFHLIHPSADVRNAAVNTVRGAFEYQGQKCSATSRTYVPESLWPSFKKILVEETEKLRIGPPEEFGNFVGPVIHEQSWTKLNDVIEKAKSDSKLTLLTGGKTSRDNGWYIHPTIYQTSDPKHELLSRELFGPVLTVYVFPDAEFEKIPALIDAGTEYGLTGSIFAQDREAIRAAEEQLRNSAGNFYINCKSTGAVVGQQPFGGARASGTNDKGGSVSLLTRFTSQRAIKEDFLGAYEVEYPSNEI